MAKTRELTPKQEAFLESLFGEAKGVVSVAKKLAGYADTVSDRVILQSLQDEIIANARLQLAMYAPRAALSMSDIMENPVSLGAKEKMRAAEQILDRVGIVKTEKIEVDTGGSAVILLPPKN